MAMIVSASGNHSVSFTIINKTVYKRHRGNNLLVDRFYFSLAPQECSMFFSTDATRLCPIVRNKHKRTVHRPPCPKRMQCAINICRVPND